MLDSIAPLSLAESWDNVGLLLGDGELVIDRIMTCLTVTQNVVSEAIEKQAKLIVSHHPILFKPANRITTSTEEGRLLWQLTRQGIAVYSPHTAYDNAEGGINDQLAQLLKLQDVKPLVPAVPVTEFKVITFVPETDLNQVSQAIFDAGAGRIGNYERCSFRSAGIGTFQGNALSNPSAGKAGEMESTPEWKLEVVCPQNCLHQALAAIRKAHSYEEPAIDIIPLHNLSGNHYGSCRIGRLAVPLTPKALAEMVSSKLQTPVSLTGDCQRTAIQKVAIVCGAGGSLLSQAIQAGADAFLTGEIRFHDELAAQAAGLTVIAAGHYATERPGIEQLAQRLADLLPGCTIWASSAEQNPSRYVSYSSKSSSD